MPIKKRILPPMPTITPIESVHIDDSSLLAYLRGSKERGLRGLFIDIPIASQHRYVAVDIDELIKLVERSSVTLPKEPRPVKPPIKRKPMRG